jgi:predicted nucleotidyltransferase
MVEKESKKLILKKIKKYIKIIQENGIDIGRLYLFGSYATGKINEYSDIDLAIFLNKEKLDGFEEDVKLMHLRRKVDLRIEPHSFTMSDLKDSNPFIKEIITVGERII